MDNAISSVDLAEQKQKSGRILYRIGKFCELLALGIVFVIITGLFCIPTIFYLTNAVQVSFMIE